MTSAKGAVAEGTFRLGAFVMNGRRVRHRCRFKIAVGGHGSSSEIQRAAILRRISEKLQFILLPPLHGIR